MEAFSKVLMIKTKCAFLKNHDKMTVHTYTHECVCMHMYENDCKNTGKPRIITLSC